MVSSDESTLFFIELIRDRPCLYDHTHPNYKDNATVKRSNWIDIARQYGEFLGREQSIDDVQKRWANLRDTFMMCKRKYESSVASGMSAPEPKWKWWTSMDWYLEYRRKKEGETSVQISTLPGNSEETIIAINNIHAVEPLTSTPASASGDTTTTVTTVRPYVPIKRKIPFRSEGISKLGVKDDRQDEAHHFGMSIASRYRKLSSYQQALARKDIESVLFKVEFETPKDPPAASTDAEA